MDKEKLIESFLNIYNESRVLNLGDEVVCLSALDDIILKFGLMEDFHSTLDCIECE